MRRWSWHWFVAAQILVTYENALFVVNYATSHHRALAFLLSLVLQICLYFRVSQEVRVPYFFPRIRWWESNPRYRLAFSVTVNRSTGPVQVGEVLDLSTSGCFIKLRNDLAEDETVSLTGKLYGYEMKCDGVVVWISQSTVTSPKGVGVKFTDLSREQKKAFRGMVKKIKKISTLYRRYRYWNPDEFTKRLEAVEKNLPKDSLKESKDFKDGKSK